MRIPSPPFGPGKSGIVRIGNPKATFVLDFDEVTAVGKALHAIGEGECDGGVEGGVSSSSDDERESAQEDVSEMREGVRETGGLAAGGDDGSMLGEAVVLVGRFGSAAILRLRGVVMDFACETVSVFCDWGFRGKPDILAVTGDKAGDAPDFSDLGAQAHVRVSCTLRPASRVVIEILAKRGVNRDTSAPPFASSFPFLTDDVNLN